MFHIVLFQPEIPPNTGSVIRLCANTGCHLHLIEPLGFTLDDKKLKRAGLDYHAKTLMTSHIDFESFKNSIKPKNIYYFSSKAKTVYSDTSFEENDALVFGPETKGLPSSILDSTEEKYKLTLPMKPSGRSLNLAVSVSIATYEAWRQNNFK